MGRTDTPARQILPFESIDQTADHGARHGPLRVLREVTGQSGGGTDARDSSLAQRDRLGAGRTELAEAMIVAMATVFARHPDFDPEWLGTLARSPARSRTPSCRSRGM